jgi:hypothetical protein
MLLVDAFCRNISESNIYSDGQLLHTILDEPITQQ